MNELNLFFWPLMTPFTSDQPLSRSWKLSEKKKNHTAPKTSDYQLLISKFPKAAGHLWAILVHSLSIFNFSQGLAFHHSQSLSNTCSPMSVSIEAKSIWNTEVIRWSPTQLHSTHLPPYLHIPGSLCNSILFRCPPPPLPGGALPFIPTAPLCWSFSCSQVFLVHINSLQGFPFNSFLILVNRIISFSSQSLVWRKALLAVSTSPLLNQSRLCLSFLQPIS